MEDFINSIQAPLLPRVQTENAPLLFDVEADAKRSDEDTLAAIMKNVEKAQQLAMKKVNKYDVINYQPIPDITHLTYPSYYVFELNVNSSVVFELSTLEGWIVNQLKKTNAPRNPYTNTPFPEKDLAILLRRFCVLRIIYLIGQMDTFSDKETEINDVFTQISHLSSVPEFLAVRLRLQAIYSSKNVAYISQDKVITSLINQNLDEKSKNYSTSAFLSQIALFVSSYFLVKSYKINKAHEAALKATDTEIKTVKEFLDKLSAFSSEPTRQLDQLLGNEPLDPSEYKSAVRLYEFRKQIATDAFNTINSRLASEPPQAQFDMYLNLYFIFIVFLCIYRTAKYSS